MKILFIDYWDGIGDFFREERNKYKNVDAEYIFKDSSAINKIFRKIGRIFSPVLLFAYGPWKKRLDIYDLFIVDSRVQSKYAIEYIKRKTNKRVVVWYWNVVTNRELSPDFCKKLKCETWSFNPFDCKKYDMKFNSTYYFKNIISKNFNPDIDLFYIGIERQDRIEIISKIESIMEKRCLKAYMRVMKSPVLQVRKNYKYSNPISYNEVLKLINRSRAILDLTQTNQNGMSLRPMEALFFKKKLVTNNKSIINAKFYDKRNIFILNDNNFHKLPEFLETPYTELQLEITDYYDFENWLNRIIDCKE